MDMEQDFKELTGHEPLAWQKRLYKEHFIQGDLPPVIDIPTGLGKTMIMAIWLIARAKHKGKVPTRLIYVVDRRTVVDQATDLAQKLHNNCKRILKIEPPAISTLRGQLADNREWSRDLSRPAIIIGTVDLIGSALLFSGYRSSYKRRPLEAGLLGLDSLLILDEAHLSSPFKKLLVSVEQFQSGRDDTICNHQGMVSGAKPLRVIRMSATSGNPSDSKPFVLQLDSHGKLTGEDAKDETVTRRFGAKKTISVVKTNKPIEKRIAIEADKLATEKPGSRIVIFVRTPKQVDDIRSALKQQNKAYATCIARLTGTMRGLERDELVTPPTDESQHERRVMQRFLNPDNDPTLGACFLISTSAGEVGFDLNADHMVCDATTIDSLIQRLGRVNRRGLGDAQIHLIVELPKMDKDRKPKKLEGLDLAIANTIKLLDGITDVSPQNIAALKASDVWKKTDNGKSAYENACSPDPTTVELTDILLDAWSMTSITEPMPGRPEVGPWLRGIAEWEPPQTTVAWRTELDLDGFAGLDTDDIEEWFDAHRVLTHETLSVKTSDVADWFQNRWKAFSQARQAELHTKSIIIDRAGLEIVPLGEVIRRLSRKSYDADTFLRGAQVIVPVSFGGISRGVGLLDPTEPKLDKDEEKKTPEERQTILKDLQDRIDVADVRKRYREIVEKTEDGEAESRPLDPHAQKPLKYARYALDLGSDDDKTVRLVSYIPRQERLETGQEPQTLQRHVDAVRKSMDAIATRLTLPDEFQHAAQLAADWHDRGKNRERWQRLLVFPGNFVKPKEPMAKSGGEMKRDPRGYRHEFGSLSDFTSAFHAGKLLDITQRPISQEVFDLAAHLIAVHHGRSRPHFPKGGFDPDCESSSDQIHAESIRRFARLQRKYGWWRLAWLENLLRCADTLASAGQNASDDSADSEGGTQ